MGHEKRFYYNGSPDSIDHNKSTDTETTYSVAFNPLLLVEQDKPDRFTPGIFGYYYRNYAVSLSITIRSGYPHRVLSITPHGFDPQKVRESELGGLLDYFGFYSFIPIDNYAIGHPDDPYTGDTQYYRQMIMDLADLKDPAFPVRSISSTSDLSLPDTETA